MCSRALKMQGSTQLTLLFRLVKFGVDLRFFRPKTASGKLEPKNDCKSLNELKKTAPNHCAPSHSLLPPSKAPAHPFAWLSIFSQFFHTVETLFLRIKNSVFHGVESGIRRYPASDHLSMRHASSTFSARVSSGNGMWGALAACSLLYRVN